MAFDLRSSELEHNFIKEHISSTEKHFDDISSKLSSYIKKLANLRDKGDEVAKSISNFASKETYNESLRLSLGEFSDVLSSIQAYHDAEVNRIQVKVIHRLNSYHELCADAKNEIKKCFETRVKELKKKNELDKVRSKTTVHQQKIAQAEKEVNLSQEDTTRKTQAMVEHIERFEKEKLKDLKLIFLEFAKIEMIFHAKAIELYTKSYNILNKINVEGDLNEFTSHFRSYSSISNAEALSSSSHATVPNMNDVNTENSTCIPYKSQTLSGIQGNPRSVFTLKATVANTVNSNSSSEGFVDSKYESRD